MTLDKPETLKSAQAFLEGTLSVVLQVADKKWCTIVQVHVRCFIRKALQVTTLLYNTFAGEDKQIVKQLSCGGLLA